MVWSGKRHSFNEFIRKKLVYLKRNTKIIPFICIIITCMVFTFKLSLHSQAALATQEGRAALFVFIMTLSSIMSIIVFVGFKRFSLKGMIPFCITLLVLALQIVLELVIIDVINNCIDSWLPTMGEHLARPTLLESMKWAKIHIVFLCIAIFFLLMLPVMIKLFSLIKTSLPDQFEETEEIDVIVEDADE